MRPAKAVVFDFDGVLAQSMELHAEAYRRILAPYGIQPTDRDIFLQEGARSETIIRDALENDGHGADEATVKRLADQKQEAYRALGPPRLYDGARALVHRVHQVCPKTALVTGTRRSNLEALIPDLLPDFEAVLAQDAYTHDKPHPEPYSKAAKALAVAPADCIVLENAVRGVESAKAAGYGHVIAITTTVTAEDLAAADTLVATHQEALDAIVSRLAPSHA